MCPFDSSDKKLKDETERSAIISDSMFAVVFSSKMNH